jgi:hypothetical protein
MEKAESSSVDSTPATGHDVEKSRDEVVVGDVKGNNVPTVSISAKEYRKLIWKLDLHLLPPLFALWFVSLIDRINIGSANIFGIQKDLNMNPRSNQFNVALIIVLIGLITCEVPSNYLLKKTSPSKVLALESLVLGQFVMVVSVSSLICV